MGSVSYHRRGALSYFGNKPSVLKMVRIKEKIKNMGWFLFAPIAFIIWTIDYYLAYFGLSFLFYGISVAGIVLKIILILSVLPIAFTIFRIFVSTTLFTATLATKHKIIYLLLGFLYSVNRITSVIQYCSVKSPIISDSIIIEIPCWVNLLITFTQIIFIFSFAYIAITNNTKDKND